MNAIPRPARSGSCVTSCKIKNVQCCAHSVSRPCYARRRLERPLNLCIGAGQQASQAHQGYHTARHARYTWSLLYFHAHLQAEAPASLRVCVRGWLYTVSPPVRPSVRPFPRCPPPIEIDRETLSPRVAAAAHTPTPTPTPTPHPDQAYPHPYPSPLPPPSPLLPPLPPPLPVTLTRPAPTPHPDQACPYPTPCPVPEAHKGRAWGKGRWSRDVAGASLDRV